MRSYLARSNHAVNRAIPLPGITQGEGFTLTLYLGSRAVGYDMLGQAIERAGPGLDLTGATVKLTARRVPDVEPYYTRDVPGLWYERSPYGYVGAVLFTLDGAIPDPANGKAVFTIPNATTALGLGLYLVEPRATLAGGFDIVPAGLSLRVAERV